MDAAYGWLDVTSSKVPVWTGASRATFMRLASYVGYAMTYDFPAPPKKSRWGSVRLAQQKQLLDQTSVGIAASDASYTADGGIYRFSYSTTLPHLIVNEFEDANAKYGLHLIHPGPYDFQGLGKVAYLKAFSQLVLPDWWDFIKFETKQVL